MKGAPDERVAERIRTRIVERELLAVFYGRRAYERTVHLERRVPIHLLYWTAWADDDGTIHFRPDIHGLDSPLAAALAQD